MNTMRIALLAVLAGFLGLTTFVVAEYGYVGFFELANANWATRLLFVDLAISLALILAWMWADARERGATFAPFALLTLVFGAAGPLLYLIRRSPVRTTT